MTRSISPVYLSSKREPILKICCSLKIYWEFGGHYCSSVPPARVGRLKGPLRKISRHVNLPPPFFAPPLRTFFRLPGGVVGVLSKIEQQVPSDIAPSEKNVPGETLSNSSSYLFFFCCTPHLAAFHPPSGGLRHIPPPPEKSMKWQHLFVAHVSTAPRYPP